MKAAIHQFLPSFAERDAIGRHTILAQRLLRDAGFESEIYAGESRREVARLATPYQRFTGGDAGQPVWLLYQCSTGSPVGAFCAARPEPLVLDYHNITPAELFEAWEPSVGVELIAGRKQLADLAPTTEFALADSAYNAAELTAVGFRATTVAPILLDLSDFDDESDPATADRLAASKRAGGVDWLFVGRVSPQKAHHDILKAFAAYVRTTDPDARLHLVGGSASQRYEQALRDFAADAGIAGRVNFAMSVSHAELVAYYRGADVFVCLSDHEGFCVPLLEAMHHGVPIVAFAAAAVPETLGSAGILLDEKRPLDVAAAVERVVTDADVRRLLVAAGHQRVADFALDRTAKTFMDAVAAFTDESR